MLGEKAKIPISKKKDFLKPLVVKLFFDLFMVEDFRIAKKAKGRGPQL